MPAGGESSLVHPAPTAQDGPVWFAVTPAKFVIMTVATAGLYEFYWFYRQWRAVRDAGEHVRPLLRAFFAVIFCYPLFRRVAESAAATWNPVPVAATYLMLCFSADLPFPYGAVALLSVLPLVTVQRAANAVAREALPDEVPDSRLTAPNWAAIACGCAILGFLAYGAYSRHKATSLEFLSAVAAEMNRQPRAQSEGVQLNHVVPERGLLIYYFDASDEARARLAERGPFLKTGLRPGICGDRLLKLGVAVRFVYTGPGGDEIATVDFSPEDCS